VHRYEVLLPGALGASTTGKPANDGVDDFPVTSPLVLPQGGLLYMEIHLSLADARVDDHLLAPSEGSGSSASRARPSGGSSCALATLDKLLQVPGLNKFFYLILEGLTFLGGMFVVLVIPTPFLTVDILWA